MKTWEIIKAVQEGKKIKVKWGMDEVDNIIDNLPDLLFELTGELLDCESDFYKDYFEVLEPKRKLSFIGILIRLPIIKTLLKTEEKEIEVGDE